MRSAPSLRARGGNKLPMRERGCDAVRGFFYSRHFNIHIATHNGKGREKGDIGEMKGRTEGGPNICFDF